MIMAKVVLHTQMRRKFSRNIPRSPTLIKLEMVSKILGLKITMTSVIVIRKKHGTSYHWLT